MNDSTTMPRLYFSQFRWRRIRSSMVICEPCRFRLETTIINYKAATLTRS